MSGFMAIEGELQKRREQAESVKGKDTPYRIEFRYSGGMKYWQYFTSLEECASAKDSQCGYTPTGNGYVVHPLSQQTQVRGPKGGWAACKLG